MSSAATVPPATAPRVSVAELLEDPELAPLIRVIAGARGTPRRIEHSRIQKSGLALAGHLVGVVPSRVQILGETEVSYLDTLGPSVREERLRSFLSLELCCVIVTRGVEPASELVALAEETGTPLVVAAPRSSATIAAIHLALDRLLAPREAMHGVMIEVHGLGILLTGESGIGKSECALVMIERGHRLIADDRVELVRSPAGRIRATPSPLLRHHLEIRGLGILNVRDLFGATAVQDEATLDLMIELCRLDEPGVAFDRLGIDDALRDVLGVPIPTLRIPVYPGRDMGVLLEVAARNQLLKRAGHHSARLFASRLHDNLGVPSPRDDDER